MKQAEGRFYGTAGVVCGLLRAGEPSLRVDKLNRPKATELLVFNAVDRRP